VRCSIPRLFEKEVKLFLGDRSDQARLVGISGGLFGGTGNDVLISRKAVGVFTGGPGDDRMLGGGFSDTFVEGARDSGSDYMLGRGGQYGDAVDYSGRRRPVFADLDGRRDDGQRGEGDRIIGVENLTGGRGADRLTGDDRANSLRGGRGSDRLYGKGGNDTIEGDGTFSGNRTATDQVYGGRGNDEVRGGAGADLVVGGQNRDYISGQGGNDRIPARDHAIDHVVAASGCDRVSLDPRDWYQTRQVLIDAVATAMCTSVQRDGPAGLSVDPFYEYGAVDDEVEISLRYQNAGVVVGCPGDAPPVCEATVRVLEGDQLLGETHASVRRNAALNRLFVPVQANGPAGRRAKGSVAIEFDDQHGGQVTRRTDVELVFRRQ
jgi:hypothetical protein